MRWIRDPQQKWMFDPFDGVLSAMARRRITSGWQGIFRTVVLDLLPVKELSQHFSEDMGCPTKELDSMAGLVFLADFFDWNALDAADASMMRSDVQFSLNIEPGAECSDRTVERYRKLFNDDDLASQLFRDLTIKLTDLVKKRLSLGWLHVRGRGAVFRMILVKVSGWNVLRTSASKKLCAIVQEKLAKLLGIGWTRPFGRVCRVPGLLASRLTRIQMRSNSILRREGRSVELFENQRILTA